MGLTPENVPTQIFFDPNLGIEQLYFQLWRSEMISLSLTRWKHCGNSLQHPAIKKGVGGKLDATSCALEASKNALEPTIVCFSYPSTVFCFFSFQRMIHVKPGPVF